MKYVTFYWSIMSGITDVEKFKTEKDALRNFRANYKSYFELYSRFYPKKLPCAYGFPHRKYFAMSIQMFNKNWAKEKRGAK